MLLTSYLRSPFTFLTLVAAVAFVLLFAAICFYADLRLILGRCGIVRIIADKYYILWGINRTPVIRSV